MIERIKPKHLAFRIEYQTRTSVLASDVEIGLPFALTGKKKDWEKFKAIWDTGATNSVISEKVITALGLKPTGRIEVSTAGGKFERNTYIVDIGLLNRVSFTNVRVTDGELSEPYSVLIGMDIISTGDLSISNANNKTVFTFCMPPLPNLEKIDLLKISNSVNKKVLTKVAKNRKKRQRKKKW